MAESVTSGNFTFIPTSIEGVVLVDCTSFGDRRGSFMETYKRSDFVRGGIDAEFVQDNQSCSSKGVLRGLHFQINHPQAKLVRVISGEVFDVCVDLRPGSPTFGKWEGAVLTGDNHRQLFIPRGFAHGFFVLSDTRRSPTNAMTSTTRTTRAALCGMTPRSASSGPSRPTSSRCCPTRTASTRRFPRGGRPRRARDEGHRERRAARARTRHQHPVHHVQPDRLHRRGRSTAFWPRTSTCPSRSS